MLSPPVHPSPAVAAGLFGPDSVSWRVNRESALLLGGPRALLLQLAHPLVAAGVAAHSDFLEDPLGRLRRTLTTMLSIVFGDAATVAECAERVVHAHIRVRGVLDEGTRAFPAGTVYDARESRLLLWVHATLVDSALVTYEWAVAPLADRERAALYEESKAVARLLGVCDRDLPDAYAGFRRYVDGMLGGPLAEITPTARRLARAVLQPHVSLLPPLPRLPLLPAGLGVVAELVTAGLLPVPIRAAYGLAWDDRRAAAHDALGRVVRAALPWLPEIVRTMPQAREAARR